MKKVAESESHLLSVAKALVGFANSNFVKSTIGQRRKMPSSKKYRNKIGPTSMRILQEILAKGLVSQVIRRGGWQNIKTINGLEVGMGRLWNRYNLPEIVFSEFSIKLIQWLTREPIDIPKECPILDSTPKTFADEFLMYLAVDLSKKIGFKKTMASQAATCSSGLIWLTHPDIFTSTDISPNKSIFEKLMEPQRLMLVESLIPDIAESWFEIELSKGNITNNRDMIRLGKLQKMVLEHFLSTINKNNRRDLARPFLLAGRRILERNISIGQTENLSREWVKSLEPVGTMSDRTNAKSSAGSFLRVLPQLQTWAKEAVLVRFFDEEYKINKFYLSLFEEFGDQNIIVINDLLKELEAFGTPA